MGRTFATRLRYRFGDIDEAGIAYYPTILHYFHQAFEDWWSDGIGHPYPTLLHVDRLGLPAVRLEVDFFAPIRYGDEPRVHIGVLAIGRTSLTFGFWMTRGDMPGEDVLCRARVKTAAVHMDTLQGCAVPEEWRRRLAEWVIEEGQFPAGR